MSSREESSNLSNMLWMKYMMYSHKYVGYKFHIRFHSMLHYISIGQILI